MTTGEASIKLCSQVEYADEAIVAGNFLAGGLRLASGIADYSHIADAALVGSVRQMLSTGRSGDAEGYVAARSEASTHCTRLGRPIRTGGIQCVTFPCP